MNPIEATIPDTEIDEFTGKLKKAELKQNTIIQSSLNRNLLYTKAEVEARIKASLPSGSGTGIVQTVVAGTNVTVDSTDPANPIVSSSGGSSSLSVVAKATSYTLTNSDDVVEATNSGIVLTLHSAASATSKAYTLVNSSNGNISFATTSAQTVNGSTIGTIIPNQSLVVVPRASNWNII